MIVFYWTLEPCHLAHAWSRERIIEYDMLECFRVIDGVNVEATHYAPCEAAMRSMNAANASSAHAAGWPASATCKWTSPMLSPALPPPFPPPLDAPEAVAPTMAFPMFVALSAT